LSGGHLLVRHEKLYDYIVLAGHHKSYRKEDGPGWPGWEHTLNKRLGSFAEQSWLNRKDNRIAMFDIRQSSQRMSPDRGPISTYSDAGLKGAAGNSIRVRKLMFSMSSCRSQNIGVHHMIVMIEWEQ